MTAGLSEKVGTGFSVRQADRKNLPALRFPEFSGEWPTSRFDEIGSVIRGASPRPRADPRFYGGDIPRLMVEDVARDGKHVTPKIDFLTEEGAQLSRLCPAGTLTVVCSGTSKTVGQPSFLTIDACIHDGFLAIKDVDPRVHPDFLFYQIQKFQAKAERLATHGGTFINLTTSILKEFKRAFPECSEQKKITAFLGVVDTKIAALRARVAGLERYKRGLMQALFSQTLRFTKPDGTPFPDWEEKRLGEVFAEVTDKVGQRDLETYSISAGKGWVSQKEKFGKDISGQQNEKYTALRVGDFSYNKGNSKSYRYGCIYANDTDATIGVPNVFISFRAVSTETVIGFYGKLFENHFLDWGLRRLISSGARMDGLLNVNKAEFFKLAIPVPHPDEQAKIAVALSAMDAKIAAVTGQLETMRDFKKGLLQQMFV